MLDRSRRRPIEELQIEQHKLDQAPTIEDGKVNKRVSVEICKARYGRIRKVSDEIRYEQYRVISNRNSKFDCLQIVRSLRQLTWDRCVRLDEAPFQQASTWSSSNRLGRCGT